MASAMRERGVALRPHTKTHKSIAFARRQIDGRGGRSHGRDGRRGGGVRRRRASTTCSSPIRSSPSDRGPSGSGGWRRGCRLSVGADSVEGIRALAAAFSVDGRGRRWAAAAAARPDRDRRRWVADGRAPGPAPERSLARRRTWGSRSRASSPTRGHGYAGVAERVAAADDEVDGPDGGRRIAPVAWRGTARRQRGIDTDGGTVRPRRRHRGTAGDLHLRRPPAGVPGRPGPRRHGAARGLDRRECRFGERLRHRRGGEDPRQGCGAVPGRTRVDRRVSRRRHPPRQRPPRDRGSPAPARPGRPIGSVVWVAPNHVCPVVNLVDELVVARGGRVVDRWPVDARGRNS